MRTRGLIHVITFVIIAGSLAGCVNSHSMESRLTRPQGALRVVVHSDIPGDITLWDAPPTPRVTFSLREIDTIIVEQQDTESLLYIGNVPYRIPEETQRLVIRIKNSKLTAKADGVPLLTIEGTEHDK